MKVIKKLKLNKFKSQPVVSSRQLYEMFGYSDPKAPSKLTAADPTDVIPYGAKKTQALGLAEDMILKQLEFKKDPEDTEPLPQRKPREM